MTSISINKQTPIKPGQGFLNLLYKELGGWWRTFTWAGHLLVYVLIVNGITAVVTWNVRQTGEAAAQAFAVFFVFQALFVMAGTIISAQGSIIGERQSGTAAWILSKPVSRSAFFLSKLVALGGSLAVVGVLLPVVIAYLTWVGIGFQPIWSVLPLVAVALSLVVFFYLSFVLWLGTLFESRTPVIALGFLMHFAQLQLSDSAIGAYLPGGMVNHLTAAVTGLSLMPALIGMVISTGLSTLFILLALRRLQIMEF